VYLFWVGGSITYYTNYENNIWNTCESVRTAWLDAKSSNKKMAHALGLWCFRGPHRKNHVSIGFQTPRLLAGGSWNGIQTSTNSTSQFCQSQYLNEPSFYRLIKVWMDPNVIFDFDCISFSQWFWIVYRIGISRDEKREVFGSWIIVWILES
jgi:hypothetical protein